MSFVTTQPEVLAAAAGNLQAIGSAMPAHNAAAAAPTTGVIPAAGDEVSALTVMQFATHAEDAPGRQRSSWGDPRDVCEHAGHQCRIVCAHRSRQRNRSRLSNRRSTEVDFALLPPEINSGRMYAGPGSGPMLAAAAGWDALAADLHSTATFHGSVITGLTSGLWLGPASASMAAAAAPYLAWMHTTAIQAEQAATQAKVAAAAYESAFAMTVPPPVIAANRSLLMSLIATNFLGQNTPAMAATEAAYGEMWAQDAAAMYGYAGSSAAASTLTPFTSPAPTTNPAGLAGQAAATAQAVSTPAGTGAQTIMSSGPQLIFTVPTALQGLASSTSSADPGSGLTTLATLLTAMAIPVAGADTVAAATAAPASTFSGSASSVSATTTMRGLRINADRDFAQGNGPFTGGGPGVAMLPQWISGGAGGVGEPSTTAAPSVAAGLEQRTLVRGLSVPSSWASAAPAFRPVAYALPITRAEAAPEIAAGSSGNLFGEMALAGLAGRAVGSTATLGHRERVGAPTRERGKPQPKPQGEPVTEIAAELRELAARAQSLLAKLHDSGILTDEEVTQHKRRFPGL